MQPKRSIQGKWQFWIDRGGTFTDVVARKPDGSIVTQKLLSQNPAHYKDAAIEGIARFFEVPSGGRIPTENICSIKMGTTVATNALLERKGARTVLVMTAGLEDHVEIGYQARRDIFARKIEKPKALYEKVIGATERILADGTIETELDEEGLRRELERAFQEGIRGVAIVFMHAYVYPEHEKRAGNIAREIGFSQVSLSHEVSALIKLVSRADTTIADAYLSPVLRRYIEDVEAALVSPSQEVDLNLLFMTSAGGLKSATNFHGRDAILSGPAGGVVGMVKTASMEGFSKVIGFDMGGTSTDVTHFGGAFERDFETEVAGCRMRVPMMRIHTVAAGGGSILFYDGQRFRVGPQSAGADPGPMCYRQGGPLTVTDANVMLGKLKPEYFPFLFGPQGNQPLDSASVEKGFEDLAASFPDGRSSEQIADGFIQIAVENMANAIKKISIERGHDLNGYILNCFGGAGGQHACLIADNLGLKQVLVHPLSGVLSAFGIGLADIQASRQISLEMPLDERSMAAIERFRKSASQECHTELSKHHLENTRTKVLVHLRTKGSDSTIGVEFGSISDMTAVFERQHLARFGYSSLDKRLDVGVVEVEVSGSSSPEILDQNCKESVFSSKPEKHKQTRFFSKGAWHEADVFLRKDLKPGHMVEGPALIIEDNQTVVIEPHWHLQVSLQDNLLLKRKSVLEENSERKNRGFDANVSRPDPVMLEVFANKFMSIAEQMGEALRNTARSVNIKERLDFSCAVFDAKGGLVANAPHVPVHLGSMDSSVITILKERGASMKPGDVYMLNAPYNGGTHLPDITVVTPVFEDDDPGSQRGAGEDSDPKLMFFVAARGHHEDIGGLSPGSMTPCATSIDEEGVLIDNMKIVDGGLMLEDEVRAVLSKARYPARQPEKNIADLKAQIAANTRGVRELRNLVEQYGASVVSTYMKFVQDNAEESVRRVLTTLPDGSHEIVTDTGAVIKVKITIDKVAREAVVDFTGSSEMQPDNFNAPEPVTRAAVLYVLRVMVGQSIPLNAGCLKPIQIIIPRDSMLAPRYPAAVVAGNVETSQVITNCLFAALQALGTSQGTMNNLTFGDETRQYYETICSGAPAGPDFDGVPAVQVHMTNTRLTDPEILELRYPVVLEEFSIVRGSGGRGRHKSGDGTRRSIRFLETMDFAILSGFRIVRPQGVNGGEPGRLGRNLIKRLDGFIEELKGCDSLEIRAGETITIETPTGGGFGPVDCST